MPAVMLGKAPALNRVASDGIWETRCRAPGPSSCPPMPPSAGPAGNFHVTSGAGSHKRLGTPASEPSARDQTQRPCVSIRKCVCRVSQCVPTGAVTAPAERHQVLTSHPLVQVRRLETLGQVWGKLEGVRIKVQARPWWWPSWRAQVGHGWCPRLAMPSKMMQTYAVQLLQQPLGYVAASGRRPWPHPYLTLAPPDRPPTAGVAERPGSVERGPHCSNTGACWPAGFLARWAWPGRGCRKVE